MFQSHVRKLPRFLSALSNKSTSCRRSKWSVLTLESLESRDVPAPLTWAAGVNLPAPAGGIVAQPEGARLLVLAGPTTTSYNLSVTDPTWQAAISPTVQPLDFARTSPGVGPLANGYFIVVGGTQNGFATSAVTKYDPNTVTVVDGVTNQTHSLHSMNSPRALVGLATDPSTYTSYAIGGVDNNQTPLATVEAYNPGANTWTFVASLAQTVYSESAVSDGSGHIYTFGGVGANGTIINNVYRYTIATNTWDQVAALQVGVRDSAAVLASNGLIYVLGGTTSAGATATVESYNISTNTWNLETSLPQAVSSEAAAADSLGRIEVLGGYDASGNPLATTYISQGFTQPDLAPTITSTAPTTAWTAGYTYQVLTTGNPQPSISLTAAPAGMTFSSTTGLITWSPSQAQIGGPYTVTIQASNYAGQTTQTFNVTVKQSPPTVPTGIFQSGETVDSATLSWSPSTGPIGIDHYNIYHYYATGHSGRDSNITYHHDLVGTSTTPTFTITGLVSGYSAWYTITAVDPNGLASGYSSIYTVHTLPDTVPPVLTLPPNQTVTTTSPSGAADPGAFTATATDPGPGIDSISIEYIAGSNQILSTYVFPIGTTTVTAVARDMYGNYTDGSFTVQVVLFPAVPIVTVSAGPFTYNGNPQAVTATAVGTDGVTPVAGSFAFTYDGSTTPPTDAGSYAVTAAFTSADPSYANATVTTTETINPATPTITVDSGPFAYDGVTQQSATATAVGVDGVTPVAGSFAFNYNGATTAPIGPGLFTVSTAFTSSDPNYASTTVTSNEIITSPGTLVPTLSLVDGSTNYEGNAHADTATAVDPTDGVTPVNGSFLITYNGSTTAPTQAGSYAVVANFVSSDLNYADATISGTLTISQATPTITISSSYPFYYDTFAQAQYVSEVGVDGITPVNGTLSVLYNGTSTLPVNAGTYTVSVTFTSNDPNYLSTTATGSMTIQQSGVSLYYNLNGGQYYYIYNGTPQGVIGTATGYFNNPVNGTFTYAYFDSTGTQLPGTPTAAGFYTFTEYFTSLDPNYASGSFGYNFAIYAATPTVTVTGGPFTYNGQGQGATATAVGIDGVTPVPGTASFTYNGSSSTPLLPGTYAVVATFTPTDPNYSSSTGSGTIVINKATPTFSNLSSPSVNVGTSTVTLSGHIGAGSASPGGDDVAITFNGLTLPVSVNSSGSFSAKFYVQSLGTGTYPITYEYLGDATRFNAAGSGYASGTLTVQQAPSIVTNPTSQTVVVGNSVTFSASASGFPTPTVQWQLSTNNGSTWSNISGATSTSYTIGSATAGQNGYRYRAVFRNSVGSATTVGATLTVQYAPAVTINPKNITVMAGNSASFTASASGNPTPSVQWQVSTNSGSTWTNISGATGATFVISTTTTSENGYEYRAVFTNYLGSATTIAAILTVQ
jgi:hypothetical protein